MSTIQDGGPAFPVQDASKWQAHGMTLRDYFAAKAMQGFNANPDKSMACLTFDGVATMAYAQADSMIAARGK